MRESVRRMAPKDWANASRVVAEAYFPHDLRQLGGSHEPRLTLRTLDLGPVLIGHVGWGADVSIECDYPNSYEVNMPITGHLASSGRHGVVTSVAGQGTVFRPDTPSLITHWDATCTVLGVKVDSSWFEVEVERLLGPDRATVKNLLPDQMHLEHGRGRAWRNLITGLATHLRDPDLFADSDLVRHQLAGTVVAGLVEACGHDRLGARAQPRAIKLLIQQVHDDPARPWTAADMAEVAGTSVRRLQEGFRASVGCTPTQYLVDVRLQRAHADLIDLPNLSVSDIAARWGFSSASRFAAAFRRRYGVAPATARR
ncbi:MAG: AraC family transcriptional regulator [Nocardioides marinisabuli]|uniref:AraC family transcriptional regulator n=1 Tax=Nocardioides marinisabuli TaxID=419476 RepID=UPI00321B2542